MGTGSTPRSDSSPGEDSPHSAESTPTAAGRRAAAKIGQLEQKEGQLWRTVLFVLVVLAVGIALVSWHSLRELPHRLEALPIGLVVLVALFGAYLWSKLREIAELRGLLRGFEMRAAAPPSEDQINQIFDLFARSQQGYRDLIDTFEDVLLALSLEGEIRAANRSFAELAGLPFTDIIGHRLDEFVDSAEGFGRGAAEKALPHFLERRHWSGTLAVRLRRGGAVRYLDCVFNAIVKYGQVIGVSILARDITRQREDEARFTQLFETLQEGVYCTTREGQFLEANPALARMLGYESKEELMRVNAADLYFDPAERATGQAEIERLGTIPWRERTLRRKDGSSLHCLISTTAVRDDSGCVARYQGTVTDITERRNMELSLHQEQEFAHRLIDSFPDPIFVLDCAGHFTYASPRVKEMMGYTPEEYVRIPVGTITHPEDRPALMQAYDDLRSGKAARASLEYRIRKKDGELRLVRGNAAPLLDAQGKIVGVVASTRDLTDLKHLEQQVAQSEKLAAMGQMMAGVAHELNNPLTAILGVTEFLRDSAKEPASRRQLELAHNQARRASHIVQSLLSFSQPAAPLRAPLRLEEVIARTLQLHEQSLQANHVSVDLSSAPGVSTVVGDADQLTQVFLNLLINAEQAIHEIHDRGSIHIHIENARDGVEISVQDDGAGIRSEAMPRLFDPFFTTKRPGGGTGLGLSICMAIVREHGGNIEAEALSEGGARFRVWLPAEQSPSSASPPATGTEGDFAPAAINSAPSAESRARSAAFPRGLSVLVIDDEEIILDLVKDGLTARGLTADCASTGEQALKLAARRNYDAVLCDLNLAAGNSKAMCGMDLLHQMQARAPDPKPLFIFMTGDAVEAAAMEVEGLGHVLVAQKPFRISDLVALLTQGLESSLTPQPCTPSRDSHTRDKK